MKCLKMLSVGLVAAVAAAFFVGCGKAGDKRMPITGLFGLKLGDKFVPAHYEPVQVVPHSAMIKAPPEKFPIDESFNQVNDVSYCVLWDDDGRIDALVFYMRIEGDCPEGKRILNRIRSEFREKYGSPDSEIKIPDATDTEAEMWIANNCVVTFQSYIPQGIVGIDVMRDYGILVATFEKSVELAAQEGFAADETIRSHWEISKPMLPKAYVDAVEKKVNELRSKRESSDYR